MTVLVTGASGKVGRRVLAELATRGQPARPATRRSEIPLDWANPVTWEAALAGVDRLFLVLPGGDDGHRSVAGLGEQVIRFLDLAARRGVERVVLMTALGMEYAPADVGQRAVELSLQDTGLRWTIVRPNWFHQNITEGPLHDLAAASGGQLRLPVGDAAVSFIDTRDIAAVIATALTEDHHQRQYALTGPEPLTFAELAAIAAAAALPARSFQPVTEAEFRSHATDLGWAADYVDTLCLLFDAIRSGAAAGLSQDAAEVLGRDLITFAEFAARESGR